MKVWVGRGTDGALVDNAEARISVFDHGFTVADGIFETVKVVDGKVFLWPWHLERLQHSASLLGLSLPDAAHLTSVVGLVARENVPNGTYRLRLTITGGDGPLGSDRTGALASVVCAAAPTKAWPATAHVRIAGWPRNDASPLVHAKTTSYAENVLALEQAHKAGASEALFFNTKGLLTEGTGSNVFIVRDGLVRTPRLADGLLAGITRRFVLQLAASDMSIEEAAISRSDLAAADEVFLTSSTRDIQAIDHIDDDAYAVGPVTVELQRRFSAAAAADWCWL